MEIADIKGKLMPALDVFALSIEFLKEHLMMTLSTQGLNFKSMAIQWVLTVPSIWTDTSKHFMRQSAIKVRGTKYIVYVNIRILNLRSKRLFNTTAHAYMITDSPGLAHTTE